MALTKSKQKEYIEELEVLFAVVSNHEPPQKGYFQTFSSNTPSPIESEELCEFSIIIIVTIIGYPVILSENHPPVFWVLPLNVTTPGDSYGEFQTSKTILIRIISGPSI